MENLTLKIASDNPHVLAWPWEALRDPQSAPLAHTCRIERQLSKQLTSPDLPTDLPRNRINILLVVARPYDADVGFRTLSRPLLDLISSENLPAKIDMLRPPTFDQLRQHLRNHPGYYHIVHFDGHGGYGPQNQNQYKGNTREGRLIFETDTGQKDSISAEKISSLLREYRIPIMVLNACQSAMYDSHAEDEFASVAASLQRAGIRSVVAMAYSLYVSGAQEFIPAFYQRLFESGSITEATRAGRQAMLRNKGRVCALGTSDLDDWLVPVVYQQKPMALDFANKPTNEESKTEKKIPLPQEITTDDNPYGFIGRDSAQLALERALRRPPAGILIHGLGGIGKTTLAKGFVKWLADTNGLQHTPFWFTFNDIRSSEHVLNQMVGAIFDTSAMAADTEQKRAALLQAFKEHPFIIVWDNFESVSGIAGTDVHAMLPEQDRKELKDFLYQLHGGKTKILITSRSQESWLNQEYCYRLPLGGLKGEERWAYCNAIVQNLGLTIDRQDRHLSKLMDLLDGHPLMMRTMLLQLGHLTAGQLITRLRNRLQQVDGDDTQAKLFATLGFVEEALPDNLKALLMPLALHERFVEASLLEFMAKTAEAQQTRTEIDQLLSSLETAGLLHNHGQGMYGMHPALTGFLRSHVTEDRERWQRAFVDIMGQLANSLAPKPLHEQRMPFYLQRANFHTALEEAEKLAMDNHFAALNQALAIFAQNQRDFVTARRLFQHQADYGKKRSDYESEAAAYHQLGRIAEEQRDFAQAEQWYKKALAIKEKQGDEHGAAITYAQLGLLAEIQEHFLDAGQWTIKAVNVFMRNNDLFSVEKAKQQFLFNLHKHTT